MRRAGKECAAPAPGVPRRGRELQRTSERTRLEAILPALGAGAVFAVALATLLRASLARNGGEFAYVLDDPYIHMAIARTLARHGVWGVTPEGFAAASSSPLWTLLLAGAFGVFGVRELIPFALNALCAIGLLVLVARQAAAAGAPPVATFVLLLAVIFAAPLPTLSFSGLEHTLQAWVDVAFVAVAARVLCDDPPRARFPTGLALLAPIVTGIRYEGGFLVLVVGLLFFARRRFVHGFLVGAAGLAPIVAFALYSVAHGGLPLPNPVLLKARQIGGLTRLPGIAHSVLETVTRIPTGAGKAPHLLVLLLVSLALLAHALRASEARRWRPALVWNAAFVGTCLLHLQLAALGWFYRYEAYLVVLGLVAIFLSVADWRAPRAWLFAPGARLARLACAAALAAFLAYPLVDRAYTTWLRTPIATSNIHQQQVQMARFVATQYAGIPVAANDIGAIAFYGSSPLLDYAGLASLDVARARLSGSFDRAMMAQLARRHGVKVVLIYDPWFEATGVPEAWVRVGEWTIPDNVAASYETVSLYAVEPADVPELVAKLRTFAPRLPSVVRQRGLYRELAAGVVEEPGGAAVAGPTAR